MICFFVYFDRFPTVKIRNSGTIREEHNGMETKTAASGEAARVKQVQID